MYDNNYQIGFKDDADNSGDVAGGVTYADIETIKGKLAAKKSLQAAPSSTETGSAPYNVTCS